MGNLGSNSTKSPSVGNNEVGTGHNALIEISGKVMCLNLLSVDNQGKGLVMN